MIRVERDGPIFTVILARPDARNAVDRPHAGALSAAFAEFEADATAKVLVLTGEGAHFCSGADLKAMADPDRRNRLDPDGDGPMGPSRRALSKPSVAAVEGWAAAGGLELALLCDLRVAARSAKFGVLCRRFGVPLIDGGTVRLPRVVGLSRALDLVLTGRTVDADEALRIGLADRVVADGEARAAADALGRQIAGFPEACMLADRLSVYRGLDLPLADALRAEFDGGVAALWAGGLDGAERFADGEGRGGG